MEKPKKIPQKINIKKGGEEKNKKMRIILIIGKYLAFLFLAVFAFVLLLFLYYTYNLPRPEKFAENPFVQSTKI